MSIATIRKKTIGSNIDKMKGLSIGDLLVPGLFILVLSLLTFFVFIPSIEDTKKMRDELTEVRNKHDTLAKNLEKMEPLINNKAQLYQDLVTTKKIIPKNLDVADFAYFVDKTARNEGLRFVEIEQANSLRNKSSSAKEYGDFVGSVDGPIVYQGDYEQIVTFLDKLQDESPYIVEVRDLKLSTTGNGGSRSRDESDEEESDENSLWDLKLEITGYYIPKEVEISTAAIYSDFVPYTKRDDLMQTFNYKAKLLSENPDIEVDAELEELLENGENQ